MNQGVLLPADLIEIAEKYGCLFYNYPNLIEKDCWFINIKKTKTKLSVLFPFIDHPIHGITGLHATEKYDANGYVIEYHYSWKKLIPKQGIRYSHISAWENERHDDPNTPARFIVASEPHHHHHVPGDRKLRKENYNVHTLEAVFAFIAPYFMHGTEYRP